MLRTEAQAGIVRCQESFNAPPAPKTDGASLYVAMFCLGSGCMAWRWGERAIQVMSRPVTSGPPPGEGWIKADLGESSVVGYQDWTRPRGDLRRGYCGKAGKVA